VHPRHNSEPGARTAADGAQARVRQVQKAIITDASGPLQFARAEQNIAAAAMLLRNLPEPADPQQQALHHNVWMLVERAAVQQAESSVSCHRHAVFCPVGRAGSQQPNPSVQQQ
jgi:hypothetical protein